jgi:hypothetical protein
VILLYLSLLICILSYIIPSSILSLYFSAKLTNIQQKSSLVYVRKLCYPFIPLFAGSKFGECEEIREEITAHKCPIGVG